MCIRDRAYDERIAPVIELEPEMCSYDAASFNWMSAKPFTFQNPPAFLEKLNKACIEHHCKPEIEIFNPGMFGVIQWYTDRALLPGPCHFQYVLGVQGGLPAVPRSVFELEEYRKEMFPDSTWSAFGTSKGNLPCIFTALALGGGIRVGLEDTGFYAKGDVYKRQRINGGGDVEVWQMRYAGMQTAGIIQVSIHTGQGGTTAVSYTQLDGYKRQGPG